MKIYKTLLILGVAIFLSSCAATGPYITPKVLVTKNPVGNKVGVAERTIWLGIAFGDTDLSITTAAKKGNITKVATVDFEVVSQLLRKTYRTVVTGTNDEVEEEKSTSTKKKRSRSKTKGRR